MKATIVFGKRLRYYTSAAVEYPTSIFGSTGLLNHSYVLSSNIILMGEKKKLSPRKKHWEKLNLIKKKSKKERTFFHWNSRLFGPDLLFQTELNKYLSKTASKTKMQLSQPIYINDVAILNLPVQQAKLTLMQLISDRCRLEELRQVLAEMTFRRCKTMMEFLVGGSLRYVSKYLKVNVSLESRDHTGSSFTL